VRCILLLLLFALWPIQLHSEPTVVAEKQTTPSVISHQQLVRIFTRRELFWSSGRKITVFIKPQNSIEHKIFTINVLNLSPYKYKNLTESIVYSGLNNPPVEVATDAQMLDVLARTPNSIGYVNFSIMFNKDDQLMAIRVE
jgi:ABC-type phosphate transport system substrate-binding protein